MSIRNPFYKSKIPLTIELLQNEEKYLKEEYEIFKNQNFNNLFAIEKQDNIQDQVQQQSNLNIKSIEQQKLKKQQIQQPALQQKKDKDCIIF
ncbi:unnamed protein product [Paramecium sonneborni]|uniref:Uncharacterized protein n=1 Tax=Paramecium sonneborni TaxID=65129 RepID=A0A8S1QRM4_9CILI|nr:unnamed protein product [Paramecium sonneborni]